MLDTVCLLVGGSESRDEMMMQWWCCDERSSSSVRQTTLRQVGSKQNLLHGSDGVVSHPATEPNDSVFSGIYVVTCSRRLRASLVGLCTSADEMATVLWTSIYHGSPTFFVLRLARITRVIHLFPEDTRMFNSITSLAILTASSSFSPSRVAKCSQDSRRSPSCH